MIKITTADIIMEKKKRISAKQKLINALEQRLEWRDREISNLRSDIKVLQEQNDMYLQMRLSRGKWAQDSRGELIKEAIDILEKCK